MAFWGHDPVPKVDVEHAVFAVDHGALLVDVGTPHDWMEGHLPHALLVEPELFDMDLFDVPKDRRIVVAARNKELAEEVVGAMREAHYDAVAIEGGIGAWQKAGRPLVRAG